MKLKLYKKVFIYLILISVTLFMVFPFIWMVITSIKSEVQLFEFPIRVLPHPLTFKNYQDVLADGSIFLYLKNSFLIALGTTVITMIISIPAAYALAKIKFRFGYVLFLIILVIRMMPGVTGILSYFQIISKLGLVDTRFGVILSYLPGNVVFAVMLLRTFFQDFSQDLLDAGRIDGLDTLGTIRYLVFPLSLPSISSATLMTFLGAWNEFMYAAVLIRSPELKTMPMGIQSSIGTFQIYWGKLTANSVIYCLPVIIVTIICNKGLINGLTAGAVKE